MTSTLKYLLLLPLLFLVLAVSGQNKSALNGRWDLSIEKDGSTLPAWLEIRHSGHLGLVGRFVYAFGSARPVAEVVETGSQGGEFSFSIPAQWEAEKGTMDFTGTLVDEKMSGTMRYVDGKTFSWTGVRAPLLDRKERPIWGAPRQLFNGKDLSGWHASGKNQWMVEDGVLVSKSSGSNLISDEKFTDFKLHLEFRYPKDGNSGVYLRGRYEVQIADDQGKYPSDIYLGGVYGFLEPNEMAAKAAGEWQVYDITLIGRRVTVVANGKTIIHDQTIPGITGGALDSKEGNPGPIMLQGDHSAIAYRNVVITPVMEE